MVSKLPADSVPAFPRIEKHSDGSQWIFPGMSLRDYFAAQASESALSLIAYQRGRAMMDHTQEAAELAYAFADAMLEARKS